jgi:hypothetical protein
VLSQHRGSVGHQLTGGREKRPGVARRHRPHLEGLDPALLGQTMLSFAEMLGRLAVSEPDTYPRERLEAYAVAALGLLGAKD